MAVVRWGEQPALLALRRERYTVPHLASLIGVSEAHLRNAVKGCTRPSPIVREKLPEILGLPVEKLFTAEALAKDYDPSKNPWVVPA